ncbi:nucleotidyl transferase [Methylobacillus sp. MM3]|uniref:nucleotidyltransferase family protein n=1 Tax=Methylobacillus sp. MM3 TaxID=1848039 RepID=UPI0007E0ABDC|nr:nucleotidyltransferase family protein [Methylobacillus sp. MM3]OAJ71301.1 nucleotidyl transferase [Methylobacillus sp. MM3]
MSESIKHSSSEPWHKTLLPPDATLQQAIMSLDASALQIAMVVGPGNSLIGTLTDGDIRRGLLRGLDMQSPVASIVNREPLVVPPHLEREMVLQLMQANKVRQLPVVDGQRCVLGLHVWDELLVPVQRPNTMVIMAGGQGMRLRPYTERCPKPMLPVGGKPMLEHIIERARGEGFQRFILAVHYLGHMIEDYFGDGSRWQISIEYLREETPLGTAGALALLHSKPDVPLIVTNGDVLTDIHYGELLDFHNHHGAAATMAVRLHEWQHPFGVVRTSGVDIVGFEEKPVIKSHINAGVYALDPSVLDHMQKGEHCDMPTLFGKLQERGLRAVVYPMHEPWLDVGRIDDYAVANQKAES